LFRRPATLLAPIATRAPLRRTIVALAGAYLALQTLIPLRHFLYPGTVHWTEEGHNFSWHMKLRDKASTAIFFLTDADTKKLTIVDPRSELTPDQVTKMSGRPDMILEYAQHLARTRAAPGQRLEVRARVMASLNGRSPQLLIDPNVDLVGQSRGLAPSDWIVPLSTPLRRPPQ
jgi:hypothetical protein